MQQSDNIKQLFLNKYSAVGEEKFYKFLISYALNRIVETSAKNGYNPAIELIDYYDMFLKLYRREGNIIYLELAKQFRRAAHRIFRVMLKQGIVIKSNKFLVLVS